jgi:hypothetical protein
MVGDSGGDQGEQARERHSLMSVVDAEDAKMILRSAREASGASASEFQAAMLGVLSTTMTLDEWIRAAGLTVSCFRDRT